MGIKRKGSRLIRVGGVAYRWTVSRSIQAETGKTSIIIEAVEQPGQRITVQVPCRDFWLDFSDLRDAPPAGFPNAYRPITPAMVEKIITAALTAGWLGQERQKNRVGEWTEQWLLVAIAKVKVESKLIRKRR